MINTLIIREMTITPCVACGSSILHPYNKTHFFISRREKERAGGGEKKCDSNFIKGTFN